MKLAVITCGVFGDEATARAKLWVFLRSCSKVGIEPLIYGMDRKWTIYRHIKLDMQLEFLKTLAGYTHILYSDGQDALMLAGTDEILEKYRNMGAPPIVASASHQLANVSEEDKMYPGVFPNYAKYRYPHVGGTLAEIPALIDAFERMMLDPSTTSDDCFIHFNAVRDGWYKPRVDDVCSVFQVTDEDCLIQGSRIVNRHTGSSPCVWHVPGGYSSQETGKDYRMVPLARSLGIIE